MSMAMALLVDWTATMRCKDWAAGLAIIWGINETPARCRGGPGGGRKDPAGQAVSSGDCHRFQRHLGNGTRPEEKT